LKLAFECPSCLLSKGTRIVEKSTDDALLRTEAIFEVVSILCKNIGKDVTPAHISTLRDAVIRKVTGNQDPYQMVKEASNAYAISRLHKAMEYVESGRDGQEKFKRACLCAAVGNAMEFDIEGYTFQNQDLDSLLDKAESQLGIDHSDHLYRLAREAGRTLLLTDNAGEIVFDMVLVHALKQLSTRVIVAVKKSPVLNDATMNDAEESGMTEVADSVITTGNDCVGFCRDESSEEFLHAYNNADLVIAKGMGYLETLTEDPLSARNAFILRAKCQCVANFLGVNQGRYVIMLAEQPTRSQR
jgi:hypothetical protein